MKFADALAQRPDFLVDVVTPVARIAHIVINLHGLRADALQEVEMFRRAEPAFDAENDAGLFRLRGDGHEALHDFIHTGPVVAQIALVEKRQQHDAHPERLANLNAIAHPLDRARVALVRHVVHLANGE